MIHPLLSLVAILVLSQPLLAQISLEEEALGYLREYLRIDSSNPPGRTVETANFLKGILEKQNIPVTFYESDPGNKINLLARLNASRDSGKKALLLLHHMDVVPADATRWPTDPFGAVVQEGYIHGRGAMDMKAHGIIHLMALIQLKRNRIALDRDVLLLAVSDEETGGHLGATWMIENHYADLDPEYVIDEGGLGLERLLSPDKTVFAVSVSQRRSLWIRLRAEGTAGHGSQPVAENANEIMVAALNRVLSQPRTVGDHPVVAEMTRRIGTFSDNKYTRAIRKRTVTVTSLRSGVGDPPKINVIPSVSVATIDCRLLPGDSVEEFIEQLRTTIDDARVQIEVVYPSVNKVTTPWDTPLFEAIESTLNQHYPEAIVSPVLIPFGTDAAKFRLQGAKAYGFLPVVVTPEIVGSMHSDNERIALDGFNQGIHIFYEIIRNFLNEDRTQ